MLTEFGVICRKIRIDHNELLADMAKKLKVSASFLSAVENGIKNVPKDWLQIISNEYKPTTNEQKKLSKAIDNSVTQVKMSLTDKNNEDKNLILEFARKFDDLEAEDKEKIFKILCNTKFIRYCPQEAIEFVQKRSDENPIKTRQSEFLAMFPDAEIRSGVLDICPRLTTTKIRCSPVKICVECKKEYWHEEVE